MRTNVLSRQVSAYKFLTRHASAYKLYKFLTCKCVQIGAKPSGDAFELVGFLQNTICEYQIRLKLHFERMQKTRRSILFCNFPNMTETRMQKSECRKQGNQSYSVLSLKVIFPNMTLPHEAKYLFLKKNLMYLKEILLFCPFLESNFP